MKYLLIIISSVVLLVSCKSKESSTENMLIGRWETIIGGDMAINYVFYENHDMQFEATHGTSISGSWKYSNDTIYIKIYPRKDLGWSNDTISDYMEVVRLDESQLFVKNHENGLTLEFKKIRS